MGFNSGFKGLIFRRDKSEENEQDRDTIWWEVKSMRNRRLRATRGKNKMDYWRRKLVSIIFIISSSSSSPQCRLCSNKPEQTTNCFLTTLALIGIHTLIRKRLTGMHPIIFHARDHFKLQADFIQSGSAKMICACGRVTSTLLVAAWVEIRSHYSRLAEYLNLHVLHEDDRHFSQPVESNDGIFMTTPANKEIKFHEAEI